MSRVRREAGQVPASARRPCYLSACTFLRAHRSGAGWSGRQTSVTATKVLSSIALLQAAWKEQRRRRGRSSNIVHLPTAHVARDENPMSRRSLPEKFRCLRVGLIPCSASREGSCDPPVAQICARPGEPIASRCNAAVATRFAQGEGESRRSVMRPTTGCLFASATKAKRLR